MIVFSEHRLTPHVCYNMRHRFARGQFGQVPHYLVLQRAPLVDVVRKATIVVDKSNVTWELASFRSARRFHRVRMRDFPKCLVASERFMLRTDR